MNWPTVAPDDHGIRPGGKPDRCFYCHQKVGQFHGRDCVIVGRRVRVKFTVTLDLWEPHAWDAEQIDFRYNESSWCANNLNGYIEEAAEDDDAGCMCPHVVAEVVGVVDRTPVVHGNAKAMKPRGDVLEPIASAYPDFDRKPREPGCQCDREEGDSPCRVHGDESGEPIASTEGDGGIEP